ncbi:ATP-binding sensor histidine kinase [Nostoc sp. PCC 7107]|uniref:ATP-binding sensor histidine kinase n=1 Tax=Nostoc sp. PCC 7107 TaxID=317936 RepID=UPI00029EC44C|nr:ATP-binding sensor histidine kinase [Nostoc sp. PCC 7107]AFY43615.1 multi-sensor signal transduction multi-kinase [Nostoc sp. PCC 7107]
MFSIPGYKLIEELYNGSRTIVYRAIREIDSLSVVIKLLKNPYPSFSELVQFRNQYTVTKNLNHPEIIQTYSLEPYKNGYALVMEDFGGVSLHDYLVNNNFGCLEEFLEIAIALCNALEILYRDQIIHKDIKPANILINPQTKQVKLIDFSIASLLPRETQNLVNPNVLEGTLAYISPEETGRMNRGLDYRTDFYSLGVTFYELLTGQLPFQSNEPMELVHCHIAKIAPLVHEINPGIPSVIAEIVSKLMAKNAEDRYQSALGLKYDLSNCLRQLKETGTITSFTIAQRDVCDRFIIPDKLYGRDTEVEILIQAFERVSLGATEIILVAGFSGIGKTAIVNEVHKPIVRQRGYFIKGKFDQFNRNIPFFAFVQAFRDLIRQLLCESDEQLQVWKAKIIKVLRENAQIIIEVIPELEYLIGKQPPVPELSGTAAKNRFNLLFPKFLQVFATQEHPLVIFLDDLQWADSTSLKLMQLLMEESQKSYLLLIGAYRDNEVSPAHPLMLSLEEVSKAGAVVNTITLKPLSQLSLNQLIADTLACAIALAQPLTELVYQKTQGNPFFATQFLKVLHQEKLITFNLQAGYWQCNITQVREIALTDDVVEFLAMQLQKLSPETQVLMQLAACIGNQFDLATLAIISQQTEMETAVSLWSALQEGLVLPQSEVYKFYQDSEVNHTLTINHQQLSTYKFLHDRVQQAAYSLIPDDQKQLTHLKIGRLLLQNTSEAEIEEKIFDVVNQLNIGAVLITHTNENQQLARLNLKAGTKAKNSTAYISASEYFITGLNLLSESSWQSDYELTLALYQSATEALCLCSDFAQMESYATVVLQQAKTILAQIPIHHAKIQAYMAQAQHQNALQIALVVLQSIGVELPQTVSQKDIDDELEQTQLLLQDKAVMDLLDLPAMIDANILAAMQILSSIMSTAYQASPSLFRVIVLKQVQLSLLYGNAPESTYAYASYGLILCGVLKQIDAGYEFGEMALQLLEHLNSSKLKPKTLFAVNCFIRHWKVSVRNTLNPLLEAYTIGLETGDIEYAAMSAYVFGRYAYLSGYELKELAEAMGNYGTIMYQFKQTTYLNFNSIYYQSVLNLLGTDENPCDLIGEIYDEVKMLPLHQAANQISMICQVHFCKMILCYLFHNYTQALDNAIVVKEYLASITGLAIVPTFYFYESLIYLSLYQNYSLPEQEVIIKQVKENHQNLQNWAENAPMNYAHKCYLVEAEIHRVLGDKIAAMELYDSALSGAKTNEYIQEEALANELAAKFYLDWGKEKFAEFYMQEAYYCYARWGAKAKIDNLEQHYPQLLQPILQQHKLTLKPLETISVCGTSSSIHTSTTGSTKISDALDLNSVLKAAQTISSSIELNELVASLTQIILENSGAKKSALILPLSDTLQVRAITFINHHVHSLNQIQTILEPQAINICQAVPRRIINYVKNTQETIVINDCQTDIPGVIGEYMLEHQPKSILCTPIINQNNLIGILYLENKLTSGVFTNERLQVINLLSSQAAIALENATLYQKSQQALQDLQQAQLQIIQSEKMSALGNLVAGIAHEMNNPLGFIAATLQQAKPNFAEITEHLKLYQEIIDNPSDKIQHHAEEIDLDYLLEDLPKMINAMVLACDRLKNISTSLRTFSRADQDYKVKFNLHEGIDSTILILKHRLKANEQRPAIDVTNNYGDLPQIYCFPGQLNQVFMNILANAIDALEESNIGKSFAEIQDSPNQIAITTSTVDKYVKVSIADNAKGMSEGVKQKIFDHLFTTKGVGKGTGLGLAIARQIVVKKHGGLIEVESRLGEGTEFIIQLPLL